MSSSGLLSVVLLQACQLSLLVGFVWLMTRTLTKHNAHLSYALWLVVLLKCFTPPIWSSHFGVFSWLHANRTSARTEETPANTDPLPATPDPTAHVDPSPPQHKRYALPPPHEEAESVSTPAASTAPFTLKPANERNPDPGSWWWLIATWLGTSATMMFGFVAYSQRCIHRLMRYRVADCELECKTRELCKTLGVNSAVRLLVTACPVGPAVIGLFRPTIVVPEFIARRRTADEMEPILAHELIHIRRGDLWVGMLRHLAHSLWWFHPLVWMTSSAVRRETEKCCDEEVIATLKIPPSDYARALLGVLELKHELKTLPVVPGVRPIDITSNRMERIMKLRHGCHAKSPLWCWAIALLLALLSLPGAGLALGDGNDPKETPPRALDQDKQIGTVPPAIPKADPQQLDKPFVLLECWFVTGRQRDIRAIDIDWQIMTASTATPIEHEKNEEKQAPRAYRDEHVQSRVVKEKQLPIAYGILDADQAQALVKKFRGGKQFTVFGAPSLTVPDGSSGTLHTGNKRPFVVGVRGGEHEVRTIDCGFTCRLQPWIKLDEPGAETTDVSLSYELVMTEILDVEEVTWHTKDGAGVTVQAPETQSAVISGTNLIPTGTSLAIHGLLPMKANDQRNSTLIVVRPTVILPKKVAKAESSNALTDLGLDGRGDEQHRELWQLSLQECITIGLQNWGVHRVRIHGPNRATPDPAASTPLLRSGPTITKVNEVLTLVQPEDSLTEVETDVRNFLLEMIGSYWDLYFYHHNLEAARTGFESAHATWKTTATRNMEGVAGGSSADEAQARAQFFAFRSRVEQAKSDLFGAERRLRHLLGLTATDGRLIQPIDEPAKARVEMDREDAKQSAITRRPEMRRHAARVKEHASQLLEARKRLLKKVDAENLYRITGWDEESIPDSSGELSEDNLPEWKLGFEFQMPLGTRSELTQVRNCQLRLRREEKIHQEIETQITHQVSAAIRAMEDQYELAQTSYNALVANRDQVEATLPAYEIAQTVQLDLLLEAQRNLAQAEVDYFRAITHYNLAIADVHHRKGTLIEAFGYAFAEQADAADLDAPIKRH